MQVKAATATWPSSGVGPPLDDAETGDAAGRETRAASGFLQGVRRTGVPVTVRGGLLDLEASRDTALKAGPDEVVAAGFGRVAGLEWKVVVVLQSGTPPPGSRPDTEELAAAAGVWAMSRATAQLVIVREVNSLAAYTSWSWMLKAENPRDRQAKHCPSELAVMQTYTFKTISSQIDNVFVV